MATIFSAQGTPRALRRAGSEAAVDLKQRRAWFDNVVLYGFENLQDLFTERVTAVEPEVIDTAIQASVDIYQEQLDAMLSLWVTDLEGYPKKRIKVGGAGELQPLSQNGTPIPTRQEAHYEIGVPFMRGGDSFGGNREFWAKATVGEINRRLLNVIKKDIKWNMRRVLAAIFTNTTWTYNDDNDDIGALSIKGLANGDTDQYLDLNGDLVTANHYSAQANAIDNANNPYAFLYNVLYADPTNVEPFVAIIPNALTTATQALSAFNANPALSPFVNYGVDTTLANEMVEDYIGFGNRVLGEVSQMIVVESRNLPSDQIIAYAAGSGPFVYSREEMEAELRGLQMVEIQVDSNFRRRDFYRKRGFSVFNRRAAAVRRIGNGVYAIPAGYNAATLAG